MKKLTINPVTLLIFFFSLFLVKPSPAQEVLEYMIKRTDVPITIDGKMTEAEWSDAMLTESFVEQEHGNEVSKNTQAKMLWDDQYLYVGFICDDDDVWSSFTERDDHLWEEENVEIFCDPDGDKHNYIELEVNPLGTIFDQVVDHSWMEGSNNEDRSWNLEGLEAAVWVNGTVNDATDSDSSWYCEIAIPFTSITPLISPLSSPPQDGDEWRIQLARYNRFRDADGNEIDQENPETSLWNKTDLPWFHVPEKFGRIIFSDLLVTTAGQYPIKSDSHSSFNLTGIFPNPINTSTEIRFTITKIGPVQIEVLNVMGQVIEIIYDQITPEGIHSVTWDASESVAGLYYCRIHHSNTCQTKKMLIVR